MEVHSYVQKVASVLQFDFGFPTRKRKRTTKHTRYSLVDMPDVLLVAFVVVATKYMYPMDDVERLPRDSDDPLTLKMDWAVWEFEFQATPKKHNRVDFEHLDPKEIWSMSKDEINQYLNWFQETQLDNEQQGV